MLLFGKRIAAIKMPVYCFNYSSGHKKYQNLELKTSYEITFIETSFCENDLSLSQYKASAKSVQKVKGTQISYNSYCQGGRSGLIKLSNTPELCLKITKKSHSTLRAKRATFTFLSGQKFD